MRLVIQRVKNARVTVNNTSVAAIDNGLLVFVGFGREDARPETRIQREAALTKMVQLRIFPDAANHMNVSLADFGGEVLFVSQFTLYADCRKGRRPSFHLACPPTAAEELYRDAADFLDGLLPGKIRTGIFAADMDVALTNWGPVTIILDSDTL